MFRGGGLPPSFGTIKGLAYQGSNGTIAKQLLPRPLFIKK